MSMKRVFTVLLIIGNVVLFASTALAQTKKDDKKAEMEAAEEKISVLEASQAATDARIAEMQERATASEQNTKTIEELSKQVAELNQKLEDAIAENKTRGDELKKEIEALGPGKGFTIKGPGTSFLTIGGLLQARIETTKDASPNGSNWDWDSYLRRMRLIASGQLNKWINFFIETDNPNLGKNGVWNSPMFIQDAYLEINIHSALQIDIGMLLTPFSHHFMQSAGTLMAMDYHTALAKYPAGSHWIWRDAGIMFRGQFANDHVEYRLALVNGVRGEAAEGGRNPRDLPRLTMRWTFNVFEPEGGAGVGGMFYDGLYLAKTDNGIVSSKRVLSFGISADWQKDLNVMRNYTDVDNDNIYTEGTDVLDSVSNRTSYAAANWDAFFDIPLGESKIMSINGQVNGFFYYYGNREQQSDEVSWYNLNADTNSYTGLGFMSEIGFRYNWMQPLLIVDYYKSILSDNDAGDYIGVYGGFNAYVFAHAVTFKVQSGAEKRNNDLSWLPSIRLQAQLLF